MAWPFDPLSRVFSSVNALGGALVVQHESKMPCRMARRGGSTMTRLLLLSCAAAMALAGCGTIPYRIDGFVDKPECRQIYDTYDDISPRNADVAEGVRTSPCWLRAKEERDDYDLLFVEFDDQGWVQGTSDLTRPARDHLDAFFAELNRLYAANRDNG